MNKFKLETMKSYDENKIESIEPLTVFINSPTVPEPKELKKEDVWGDGTANSKGMRIAIYGHKCPIFNDIVEYKSTTFVFPKSKEEEVIYWVEYVYGGDCITKRKELDDLRVAIRAEYQCW